MKSTLTPLTEIYNFRAISERIGTAGQPTESQFRVVREAGFDAVINLALPTSDNALANEGSMSKLFRNVPLRTQQIMSPWSVVVSSASGSGGRREAGA